MALSRVSRLDAGLLRHQGVRSEAHNGVLASAFTNQRTAHSPPVLDTFDSQRKRNMARTRCPQFRLLSGQSN